MLTIIALAVTLVVGFALGVKNATDARVLKVIEFIAFWRKK